ncbi:hypothetical protein Psch_01462 [Pelotomaculum schinkii]|uniref:Uncharacterized protein n=1 Tax=Pelotomaculum schinkii TaxID=78350 RepID=A0A4Y7RHW4_9FIRM|nr:hypothetical protein [Pelotomaculum schinkii]TEB07907.1 hypothetical protein Psch_01462 [Pelotomaculum schinkii]
MKAYKLKGGRIITDIYTRLSQAILDTDEDAAGELAKELVALDGDCVG